AKPKFGNVKKTVQLVDLAKKAKKDEYDRRAVERLKDLLRLPLSDDMRIDVLNTLIGMAEAKNQDAYEQQLVAQLTKVDPSQEAGLQHFWDKAWAAYARGDLNGARPLLQFLRDTYRNPNLKRTASYWMARVDERAGKKEEAAATYRNLAQAPYDDIYAIESERRGAPRQPATDNPLKPHKPEWRDIADREPPAELPLPDARSRLHRPVLERKRARPVPDHGPHPPGELFQSEREVECRRDGPDAAHAVDRQGARRPPRHLLQSR